MKIAEGILPAGWIGLTLEDVAEIHDNLREPVNSSERAKRPGIYPYYGATGQVGWIDDFRQDGEYVLLGEDGAPFFEPTKEKAYLVSGRCWVNNHAHVLKGQGGLCSNRYLLYALNQANYRGYANGTTRLKLTQSAMRQLPINLAPFAEQHRIVAKIEELFSELDKGIENLKTARAQLKVYRQALLKHAFEGKLTVQWRANNQGKLETADALLKRIQQERAQRYQQQLAEWGKNKSPSIPLLQRGKTTSAATSPTVPHFGKGGLGGICRGVSKPKAPKSLPQLTAEELAELPELPEGWVYAYLSDLGDLGRGKSKHRPRNDPRLFGGIYPFVQTGEVKAANRIIRQYSQTLSDFGLQQSKLWPTGTLCITIAANIAETAFLGFDGCFPDSVVGFSAFKKTIAPEYVDFFIQAARTRIEAYAPATAQKNINLETLENLVVPYCCSDEQKQILNILEERFSIVDQLELTITTSLQQAEALRQSILKKAFSGQLVPQDPHDEPASKLLARIKAEKAARTGTAKPRRLLPACSH
jgi:type I restriction enzyme S subunit